MITFTEENRAKMRRAGDLLIGTCQSVDDVLQEVFGDDSLSLEDFHIELLQELDDHAMECQACGWWCETGELDDEQVCEDCQ